MKTCILSNPASSFLVGGRRVAHATRATVPVARRLSVITNVASQQADESFSGEWAANWSLASYEDVGEFFAQKLFKEKAHNTLGEVMSRNLILTTPDESLDDVMPKFATVSGLPVVKSASDRTLVGVVSKKDTLKSGKTVSDVMSTPPIAAKSTATVAQAAVMMLKHKIHRIPVVDDKAAVVGMVTRTDVFTALAIEAGTIDVLEGDAAKISWSSS